MKKILSLVLAAMMLVSALLLTSCNADELKKLNGKTPLELYAATLEKLQGMDNYTIESKQVIDITFEGQTAAVNQFVKGKNNGRNSYASVSSELLPTSDMECWYVDEVFYIIQGSQKAKAELDWATYEKNYLPDGGTAESALMDIPDTWFKDIKFRKDGDNYYLEFIVSGEEFVNYFKTFSITNGVDFSINDVSYKVYFDKDGNLGNVISDFEYTVEGMHMHAVATTVVSDIGTTVVTAPEGGENWTPAILNK